MEQTGQRKCFKDSIKHNLKQWGITPGAGSNWPRTSLAGEVLSILLWRAVSNRGRSIVRESAWQEKRDNRMPVQFQPLLNSDVTSVREFASPKLDCIVTGEPMVLI